MAYLDGVLEAEKISKDSQLIVFGYSQGVSIATRYLTHSQLIPEKLILYAGGVPEEHDSETFKFLLSETQITFIFGEHDPYLNPQRMLREQQKLDQFFHGQAKLIPFKGGHELKKELLLELIP